MSRKPMPLARRKPRREPYDKVLIICEGSKTEPNYFNGLKNAHRLNNANVKIIGKGATPMKIVDFAKEKYRNEEIAGDPFDKVFCVFDKDTHHDYETAKQAIEKMKPNGTYVAIISIPAFEYWLLLHYIYSTGPCTSSEVLNQLKQHMPEYEKGHKNIFTQLQDKLEKAKKNAKKSLKDSKKTDTDNPSTRVHELVNILQKLK